MSSNALRKAISIAGSQSALAARIGKSQGHVSKWLERGEAPADMVLAIEEATGVPRHELREDIYPAAEYGGFAEAPQSPLLPERLDARALLAIKPKWTVAELDALEDEGKLEEERYELLDGVITPMQARGIYHEQMKVGLLKYWIRRLPDEFTLIPETTFRFNDDNFVEPDFTFYRTDAGLRNLSPQSSPLVVEVADSSRYYDLGNKQKRYARFGMQELWVIEARTGLTHIHRELVDGAYNAITKHTADKLITPQFCAEIAVRLGDLVEF